MTYDVTLAARLAIFSNSDIRTVRREDKLEMRNPPHRLMAGVQLLVRLTHFCPFMLPSSYIHAAHFPDPF